MNRFFQGDIVKIAGIKYHCLIVSKNGFINSTGVFHVCPISKTAQEGPLHIMVYGRENHSGCVLCEQLKMIDPNARSCSKVDSISYAQIMNVSDAIQGIFEYD